VRVQVPADEVDGAERPRVRVERAGDGGDEPRHVGARGLAGAAEEVRVREDERRAPPHRAPAPGQRGRARRVLGGQAGC
jgi:hypothetical protein